MPVFKTGDGRRAIEVSVTLPGSPEAVWEAVATGPGITSWFVPCSVEEREGGKITFELGPGLDSVGQVTQWQPPKRLDYEEPDWCPGAPSLATELTIESLDGGFCKVRMVHSLFASEESWDNQLEGMEKGWLPFFNVLRAALERFPGQSSASIRLAGEYAGGVTEAFNVLCEALGIVARDGIQVEPRPNTPMEDIGLGAIIAESPGELLVEMNAPSPGLFMICAGDCGDHVIVCIQIYVYGEEAAPVCARLGGPWQAWMAEQFPMSHL